LREASRNEPNRAAEVEADGQDWVTQGVASPSIPSWNQILSFLRQMAQLRELAGSAA
jgi:hypothetical protein